MEINLENEEDELEESRLELVNQLIEFQRLKKLSELLEAQEDLDSWKIDRRKVERYIPFESGNMELDDEAATAILDEMRTFFLENAGAIPDERMLALGEANLRQEKMTLICRGRRRV